MAGGCRKEVIRIRVYVVPYLVSESLSIFIGLSSGVSHEILPIAFPHVLYPVSLALSTFISICQASCREYSPVVMASGLCLSLRKESGVSIFFACRGFLEV